MQLIVTNMNVGVWAAAYIKNTIEQFAPSLQQPFVLGLPTGGTVLDMYALLRIFAKERLINFQHIFTFNMDEYIGLSADHPQSYYSYMHRNLFDHVNIPPEHIFMLDGQATHLEEECARYERDMARVGGVNLFIGGIGRNGHLAFNEPGTPFNSRTHVTELTPSTLEANARFFQRDITRVPHRALTVGIGTLLDAKELLFIACGVKKASAVAHCVSQAPTLEWPLTALKLHSNATLLVDLDACVLLSGNLKTQLDEAMQTQPHAQQWILRVE